MECSKEKLEAPAQNKPVGMERMVLVRKLACKALAYKLLERMALVCTALDSSLL
jgi:hypothetical protein